MDSVSKTASPRGPVVVAFICFVGLASADYVAAFVDTLLGALGYSALLLPLLLYVAVNWDRPARRFLLSLSVVPLIRLVSFSLPNTGRPFIHGYLLISVPLLATTLLLVHTLDFSWREVGLRVGRAPLQLGIGLTGVVLGFPLYRLRPAGTLVDESDPVQAAIAALVLLICTGFVEEFAFRGMMQRAMREVLGRAAWVYVAALYAALHLGYQSWALVLFIFGVSLFYAWTTERTGSVAGAALSHGLMNVVALVLLPAIY
jgi:uncharacterized protein